MLGVYDPDVISVRVAKSEIPKPQLSDFEIVRGTAGAGFSCDDAGQLNFTVRLPEGSKHRIEDFGLLVTLVEGRDPYQMTGDTPLLLWQEPDGSARVNIWWLDGAPSEHEPIVMRADIRLVSGREVGPPARIRINVPVTE